MILIILLCAVLHAEAGGSFYISQHLPKWLRWLAEALLACVVSGVGYIVYGWYAVLASAIIYAGIQAATWAYLRWETHSDPNTTRSATIKPVVDFIAKAFGYKLGDEGYAWTWAAVKGLIITLPIGGLGAITFPLGHEIGTHAEGRIKGDPNMWRELLSGAGIGIACALFLIIGGFYV